MRFMVIGVIVLMLFAVFSREVRQGTFNSIDFDTTVRVQDAVAKLDIARLEGLLEDIGILASPGFSITVIIFITVITVIKNRKFRVFAIPVAFALLTLAEIYGKSVVHHPAPPFFLLKNPNVIFPTYHVWEEFSYPSGHAARAAFLGFLISDIGFRMLPKRKWVIFIGVISYIALISLSRIYLGHHWLSDVVGGVFLGSGFALLSTK